MYWTANRTFALIVGVLFTVLGLLGFLASSTMNVGNLLGFDVDLVHNLIHLATGIIALATVFLGGYQIFNRVFGIFYLVLGIAGLFYPMLYVDHRLLGIAHANALDHALHLIFGAVATYLGFAVRERPHEYREMDQRTGASRMT